jgi:hypothetical protein
MHLAATKNGWYVTDPLERMSERILTAATTITANPRETNIARMILLLLNRAYVLKPITAGS